MEQAGGNRSGDMGLLVMRLGIGLMFLVVHGAPKMLGGPAVWEKVGSAVGTFGILWAPTFWGFLAASAEFFGGLCLTVGLFTRQAAFFMAMTMLVASSKHLAQGDGFSGASHAIEIGVVFAGLIFLGAGAYSVDRWLGRRNHLSKYTLP
jgi:putative oxidoreductase